MKTTWTYPAVGMVAAIGPAEAITPWHSQTVTPVAHHMTTEIDLRKY
jgi:hypothetical protein